VDDAVLHVPRPGAVGGAGVEIEKGG
jgi:hypothetical protein